MHDWRRQHRDTTIRPRQDDGKGILRDLTGTESKKRPFDNYNYLNKCPRRDS